MVARVVWPAYYVFLLVDSGFHRNHAARVRYSLDAIQHRVDVHLLKLHSLRYDHWQIVFDVGAD
jgi:hypothetical protein